MRIVFDIETNGLYRETTKLLYANAVDLDSGESFDFLEGSEKELVQLLVNADLVIGHNIIKFDIPVLEKLCGHPIRLKSLVDTFILSCLIRADPDRSGLPAGMPGKLYNKQSLKAWGYRLGVLKGDYGEQDGAFVEYSPEMRDYCQQDVRVTAALYAHLESLGWSQQALDLEQAVANIIGRQERFGVCFDKTKAWKLYATLSAKRGELLEQLRNIFPPWKIVDRILIPKRDNKKLGYKKGVPVEILKEVEFNPNSDKHIVYWLNKRHGWTPTEFTDKGNPKMDEEVLGDIDLPEVPLLREYKLVCKRISQLADGDQAWIKKVADNGKIYGSVNSCGAATRRMTHFNPNLAQVPRCGSPYGKECRELFNAPQGYVMVGCDAAQLELRTLAHFLAPYDGGKYVQAALSGKKEDKTDIHWINTIAMGLDNRDLGKTCFYAKIYGAGFEKLGRTITKSWDKTKNIKSGRKASENLLRNLPALARLLGTIESSVKSRGYLLDLDKQKFTLRSSHSTLNELNQKAGAILMKRAQVILDFKLQEAGLVPGVDYEFMLTVHDEFQLAALPQHADLIGKLAAESIKLAGEYYNLKCPLAGDYSVGSDWSKTH